MSVRVMAAVWELDLPKPEKFLALALADFADDDGSNVFPSNDRLAWKTGDHPRNVRRLRRRLEARGVLEVVRSGGGRHRSTGRGVTTFYRLRTDNADKLPPFELWVQLRALDLEAPEVIHNEVHNPDTTAREPGHHGARTRTPVPPNPSRITKEPSVEERPLVENSPEPLR